MRGAGGVALRRGVGAVLLMPWLLAVTPGMAQAGAAGHAGTPGQARQAGVAGQVEVIAQVGTPAQIAVPAPSPAAAWPAASDSPQTLALRFDAEVDRRVVPTESARLDYAARLTTALTDAAVVIDRTQVVLMVDRHPLVQIAMLWWLAPGGDAGLVGAFPVSTGRLSGFDHYETPVGVFAHSLANPDFRAEGTKNELGIRGYGARGMRVYDFGWVRARRAWAPGEQDIRLQVHATDPDRLEQRLGQPASKGCVRIPATANRFIDHYGLLDADYDAELDAGRRPWVLSKDRVRTPWSGRWLVIVDSGTAMRPEWSPGPKAEAAPDITLARRDC